MKKKSWGWPAGRKKTEAHKKKKSEGVRKAFKEYQKQKGGTVVEE